MVICRKTEERKPNEGRERENKKRHVFMIKRIDLGHMKR